MGVATGELVFNTAMSGYQEVITDPSYAGQVIAFTNPQIGNYGTNPADDEAPAPQCRGVVVRDLADVPSNWRSTGGLEPFLRRHGVPALTGVDTRRLARHVRTPGAMPCAFGTAPEAELRAAAAAAPPPTAWTWCRVSRRAGTPTPIRPGAPSGLRIVAYDFGVKATMVRPLTALGAVTVVPAGLRPTMCWRSSPTASSSPNGPATPPRSVARRPPWPTWWVGCPSSASAWATSSWPRALGGSTYKLPFGHHGANHPVQRLETGVVEITSQNHNYAVAAGVDPRRRGRRMSI